MKRIEQPKLMFSIVERGKGKELVKLYDGEDVKFHYQTIGHGTATSEIMDILGLDSKDKDVILSFAAESLINRLIYRMRDELRDRVEARGILFDLPLTGINNIIAAVLSLPLNTEKKAPASPRADALLEKAFTDDEETGIPKKEESDMSPQNKRSLILISVNQGYSENVLDTARSHGARGGTILRARWSGEKALEKYHGIAFQEEKEIILIVVPNDVRNSIMEAVNAQHGLSTEAQALVCCLNVDHFERI